MQCKSCGSHNQTEFNAEINVHFPGLKNVDKTAVLVFPKLLLCLDCGFTEFTLSESELHILDETPVSEMQALQKR
jgi:predicted nucleic-acid-binding Zn-ribbon protein